MTLPLTAACDIIIVLFLISDEDMIRLGVLRFVYSGRTKKEESWEDGADFLPFEQLLKVTFVFCIYGAIFSSCVISLRCRILFLSPVPFLRSYSISLTPRPSI